MDSNVENIKCVKGGTPKLFSQKQLDMIGQSPDGTYDGWKPEVETPAGIPEPTQLPIPEQKPAPLGKKADVVTNGISDPNGGLTINHESTGQADSIEGADQTNPNSAKTDNSLDSGKAEGDTDAKSDEGTQTDADATKSNAGSQTTTDPNADKVEKVDTSTAPATRRRGSAHTDAASSDKGKDGDASKAKQE